MKSKFYVIYSIFGLVFFDVSLVVANSSATYIYDKSGNIIQVKVINSNSFKEDGAVERNITSNVGDLINITGASASSTSSVDGDNDGMPDAWEMKYGLQTMDNADASQDADNDGITNLDEYKKGTDPTSMDTDNDGMMDKQEVEAGRNPVVNENAVIQVIDRLL